MKKSMLLSIGWLALLTIWGGSSCRGYQAANPWDSNMGAEAILRGVNSVPRPYGSVASVEQPSFIVSSLPGGTVLYSGSGIYGVENYATSQLIVGAPGVLNGSASFINTNAHALASQPSAPVIGVVRRASGQVLLDIYIALSPTSNGSRERGRDGNPSKAFTTGTGRLAKPNFAGTVALSESDIISAGYTYRSRGGANYTWAPGNVGITDGLGSVGGAFGTADPGQFGSTILEESRAAATAYPRGSMSISASGDRKGIIASVY